MCSRAILLIVAMCTTSPALAEVTACDLLLTRDVEKAVGRVEAIHGQRLQGCAGMCFSLNESSCVFDGWSAARGQKAKVDITLDLPPFLMSDRALRGMTRMESQSDRSGMNFRNVVGFGDVAVWNFEVSKGDARGYLSAYKPGVYHLSVGISGVDGEDRMFAAVKSLARVALNRFTRLPASERTGQDLVGTAAGAKPPAQP